VNSFTTRESSRLTFNTTSLPLEQALRERFLLVREPLRRTNTADPRLLLVSPEVDALLDGKLLYGAFPGTESDILIARWCAGQAMVVSRRKTKQKPDLERVEGYDEFWALCPRKPRPGWRILGRFYDHKILILLWAWNKDELFGKYAEAYQGILDHWIALFGNQSPYRSDSIDGYVGERYRDVDQVA
jgi:hypothetical protein